MSQLIILGWDALDVELIEEFGLSARDKGDVLDATFDELRDGVDLSRSD